MDSIFSGEYASIWNAVIPRRSIRILNWNINRGLKLPDVMAFVGKLQPDLCIFQEVDHNAKRTCRISVADAVASRFKYNYVFGVEFEELGQGSRNSSAYHGQAVFARWRIADSRILRFHSQSDFWKPRWFLPEWPMLQRRRGGRIALVVELAIGRTRLVIYDVHLESQGGDRLRLEQLSEVVRDSVQYPAGTSIVVAGDLNTRAIPSPLRRYMLASGFQDACENLGCAPTKPNGNTLDWIFVRGPAVASGTKVHADIKASDHFPVSTNLVLAS